MKKYIYFIILLIGVSACKIDEIKTYSSDDYIAFTTAENDTMVISFFMLGNLQEYNCPIVVQHIGIPTDGEKEFKVTTVSSSTTMKSGYYEVPSSLKFQPMSKLDTFYLKLTNYSELATTPALLTIELQDSDAFLLGDRNYRRIHIRVNDNVAKPDWWDLNCERYFLGVYSETKFRLLMEVIQPDISRVSDSWIRSWALQFKDYLDTNPTQDEDGSVMTVPVRI